MAGIAPAIHKFFGAINFHQENIGWKSFHSLQVRKLPQTMPGYYLPASFCHSDSSHVLGLITLIKPKRWLDNYRNRFYPLPD